MTGGIRVVKWGCILRRMSIKDEGLGLQCLASVLLAMVCEYQKPRGNPEGG